MHKCTETAPCRAGRCCCASARASLARAAPVRRRALFNRHARLCGACRCVWAQGRTYDSFLAHASPPAAHPPLGVLAQRRLSRPVKDSVGSAGMNSTGSPISYKSVAAAVLHVRQTSSAVMQKCKMPDLAQGRPPAAQGRRCCCAAAACTPSYNLSRRPRGAHLSRRAALLRCCASASASASSAARSRSASPPARAAARLAPCAAASPRSRAASAPASARRSRRSARQVQSLDRVG